AFGCAPTDDCATDMLNSSVINDWAAGSLDPKFHSLMPGEKWAKQVVPSTGALPGVDAVLGGGALVPATYINTRDPLPTHMLDFLCAPSAAHGMMRIKNECAN